MPGMARRAAEVPEVCGTFAKNQSYITKTKRWLVRVAVVLILIGFNYRIYENCFGIMSGFLQTSRDFETWVLGTKGLGSGVYGL